MFLLRLFLILFILTSIASLQSCVSTPSHAANACEVFSQKYFWFKAAKKSSKKWKVPIATLMSVINQESAYQQYAKPPRKKLFGFIPLLTRESSSLGYSQATKGTWEQYKKETGNKYATRARFKDSVDFIGWYVNKSHKLLKIPKNDAYRLYLSYYLGWGNYKNYSKDKKAIIYAKRVRDTASMYRKQLTLCQDQLNRKKYIIY